MPRPTTPQHQLAPPQAEVPHNRDERRLVGAIEFDRQAGTVVCLGRPVRLARGELQIFTLLISAPGQVFSREQLAAAIWGDEPSADLRTVDQKIRRIRSALNRGLAPDPIKSIRGVGYKFAETYEDEYEAWATKGKRRLHMSEIVERRKRISKTLADNEANDDVSGTDP